MTSSLGMLMMIENNQNKNEFLDLNDDTKLCNKLDNYLRICKAAKFAEISDIVFPYKTSVFILSDGINIKEGYAAEPVLIKA